MKKIIKVYYLNKGLLSSFYISLSSLLYNKIWAKGLSQSKNSFVSLLFFVLNSVWLQCLFIHFSLVFIN